MVRKRYLLEVVGADVAVKSHETTQALGPASLVSLIGLVWTARGLYGFALSAESTVVPAQFTTGGVVVAVFFLIEPVSVMWLIIVLQAIAITSDVTRLTTVVAIRLMRGLLTSDLRLPLCLVLKGSLDYGLRRRNWSHRHFGFSVLLLHLHIKSLLNDLELKMRVPVLLTRLHFKDNAAELYALILEFQSPSLKVRAPILIRCGRETAQSVEYARRHG